MFYWQNIKDEAKDILSRALSRVYQPVEEEDAEIQKIVEKIK